MALEIFRLVGSVFVDTDAAEKSLKNTDKDAEKLGQTVINGVKSIGKFAAGVAATAAAAGAALVGIAESTREYRTEQGKLTTAFETQNFTAEQARSTYEALNGILGDSGQAVEAANHLAMLTDNEKDLNTWTKICTGVYATFGDSLPIEGLTEAANETAKTGALTGSLADALNWAGVNEDAFQESLDACANEQERQALITKTLNGLYDEAADAYRENNAEVIAANEAQDKLNNAMAKIGEAVEPAITKGKELIAEVVEKAAPLLADLAERLIPLLAGAFETLIEWIGSAVQWFQDAYTWMKDNEPIVVLLAIAIGTLTAAIIAWNIAQNAATIATTIATAATTAFGTVMAFVTSPITLVVLAIGALIAIIYLLVTNWDTVKEVAIKCWEWIKDTWSKVATWFDTKVVQPVAKFFSGLWTGVKNTFSNAVSWFKDIFSKAWTAVKNVFASWGTFFGDLWTKIKEKFSSIGTSIANAISNAVKAGINGVISTIENTINTGVRLINGAIKLINLIPGVSIGSLSNVSLPRLERGGVLERGQVGLLEGNGAEAVVPLHQNKKWISAVAQDMESAIGGGGQTVALLRDILDVLETMAAAGTGLDRSAMIRALVDTLAKPMDKKLGQLQAAKARA